MSYSIRLTDKELATLAWCANRGYFPEETYDGLTLAEGEPEDVAPNVMRLWTLSEGDAWAIPILREEDPEACFACLGGDLLTRLLALEESIV